MGSGMHSPCLDAARRPVPVKGQPRLREHWRGQLVCALGVPQETHLPIPLGLIDQQEPILTLTISRGLTRALRSYVHGYMLTHMHTHTHPRAHTRSDPQDPNKQSNSTRVLSRETRVHAWGWQGVQKPRWTDSLGRLSRVSRSAANQDRGCFAANATVFFLKAFFFPIRPPV